MNARRRSFDRPAWGLLAVVLAGLVVELLTPGIQLSGFLLIPVLLSAVLSRPALTAGLSFVALALSIPAQLWLGYDTRLVIVRSLLIGTAGVVAVALAANLARAQRNRAEALAAVREHEQLLRDVTDGMLDPQILFTPVRDSGGRIIDFTYEDLNRAACVYLGVDREDRIGESLVQTFPNIAESGLLARYVRCAETGEPVELDDFDFFNGNRGESLRYDIRGSRAHGGSLSMNYRDVTERYEVRQLLAASEERYRLLAENVSDLIAHVRDGRFVWISPSAQKILGAPASYWVGRHAQEIFPPGDEQTFAGSLATLGTGGKLDERVRVVSVAGLEHWADLHAGPFRDANGQPDGIIAALRIVDDEVAAEREADEARLQQARSDALYRRSMDSAAVGMCLADLEGKLIEVNPALCAFFGYDAEALRQMTWQQLTAADYLQADLDNREDVLAGRSESYRMVKQFIHADGRPIWGDLAVSCLRAPDGQVEIFIGQIVDITDEVETRAQLEEARREQAVIDARYRRSIDNAAVGMCLVTPQGRVHDVNAAMCQFFGYDADAMNGMRWQDVTAPEYLEEEQNKFNAVIEGRIDSYRMVKHYHHADGRLIWGDLSVSGIRDDTGHLEYMVALLTDVTARVQADERNRLLAEQLKQQSELTKAELDSAATYMASIMPRGLHGPVAVSSRYIPSRELGGDCFDYHWIDDDNLIFYLIDVSGHGIEPALLAVSLQNMLRSGTLAAPVLLSPEVTLTELNRLFQMDQQNDHYFTMWYGVYQASTRTLRYANAGAPPAFALDCSAGKGLTATALSTTSQPIGVFDDTQFAASTYAVPKGCQIFLYSDGASESVLADGRQLTPEGLLELATRVAGPPDWSLDDLVDRLLEITRAHAFDDDCSFMRLTFT